MGTISSHQKISVTHSTGCTALYECTGNLNPAFYYPSILGVKWELNWSSSSGNHSFASTNPIYYGQSGYNCINLGAHFEAHPSITMYQRPALLL